MTTAVHCTKFLTYSHQRSTGKQSLTREARNGILPQLRIVRVFCERQPRSAGPPRQSTPSDSDDFRFLPHQRVGQKGKSLMPVVKDVTIDASG